MSRPPDTENGTLSVSPFHVTREQSPAARVPSDTKSIITVIHDINNPLGKRFSLNPDGTVSKNSSVNLSCGMAVAQIMDFLPWKTFHRIVARYDGDYRVRTIPCAEQFRVLAFAQLTYRES